VLIPICSPKYFDSEWCLAEWHSMVKREEVTGTAGLIYPLIYADSDSFPEYAHDRVMRDFRPCSHPFPSYQDSPGYTDFDNAVKRVVGDLVELLDIVPDWRDGWPVDTPRPEPRKRSKIPRL
jgi:hypothetical protein